MKHIRNSVPHPIPYQGSKRALAASIISYFPDNTQTLIEPFAGSAAVSLAAAFHKKAKGFLIADANEALIDLWKAIIHRPDVLADGYSVLWQAQQGRERSFYDLVRSKFNETHRPDYFLYLLARCIKASVRYNPRGEFNQSPDNRRKGAKPVTMRARIFGASQLLSGKTEFMCADYRDTLSTVKPLDVVYMDPPYKGVCLGKDTRYVGTSSFDTVAFAHVLNTLTDSGVNFIVSYDGRTGSKTYGSPLPEGIGLIRMELDAGRSSQATLLGRDARTYESLYMPPHLSKQPTQCELPLVG